MVDVYVRVYPSAGRWTWCLVEDGIASGNGPAYETRQEAVNAAVHLFPEHAIEVEEK